MSTDFLAPDELTDTLIGEMPDLENPEEDYDEPSGEFVQKAARRAPRALKYETKTRRVLNAVMRAAAQHESTVPDAAAIIMYGPQFSEKLGNLASHDARVARAIDFITEGTENPYIAFAMAALPLAAQAYRNHQEDLSPKAVMETVKRSRSETKQREGRTFRIPFTKRTVTIRFRLHFPAVENFSNDPETLAHYVFDDPEIQTAMKKANITVAMNGSGPAKK